MGIFEFIKEGAVEHHVGRPVSMRGEPLARHSAYIVPIAAELTVEPGEVAVFVGVDHEPIGVLGPGRHILRESTAPFLAETLRHEGWAVRIWFVAIRPFETGGRPVVIADPEACVRTLSRRGPPLDVHAWIEQLRSVPAAFLAAGFRDAETQRPSLTPPPPLSTTEGILPCPGCGEPGEINAFCAHCGVRVARARICLACKHVLAAGAKFCASCGAATAAGSNEPT